MSGSPAAPTSLLPGDPAEDDVRVLMEAAALPELATFVVHSPAQDAGDFWVHKIRTKSILVQLRTTPP
jgi:hypothetical protein